MRIGTARRTFGRAVALTLLVLASGCGAYIGLSHLFAITSIEVIGDGFTVHIDADRIPNNLLFFPSKTLRAQVLADNPLLADVQFVKRFPHTLRIIPVVRLPCARLDTGDLLVLLDCKGVALMSGDQGRTLPVLTMMTDDVRVGQAITDARIRLALGFIEEMRSTLRIDSITNTDSQFLLAKSGKIDIYIPQNRPLHEVVTTLQTLMTGFRIKGTMPTVVDLRFEKPIVRF